MRNLMIRPNRFGFSSQLDALFNVLCRVPLWGNQDDSFMRRAGRLGRLFLLRSVQ